MAIEEFTDPNEIWKAIIDWETIYEVSNLGRVRRIRPTNRGVVPYLLTTRPNKRNKGYVQVRLCDRGRLKIAKVHQLVARAFLGEPPSPEHNPNHKNFIKHDNRASNLEWLTNLENQRHARRGNRYAGQSIGIQNPACKITEELVKKIRYLVDTKKYKHKEIAKLVGLSRPQVSKIGRREGWRHVEEWITLNQV
jgi:hypothetical protein